MGVGYTYVCGGYSNAERLNVFVVFTIQNCLMGRLSCLPPANRLQGWTIIILGYDFDIRCCRTTDFSQADALTHLICNQQEPEEDTVIVTISIEDDVRRQLSDALRGISVTVADLRRASQQDSVLRQAITYVQTCWPVTALAGDLHRIFLRRAVLRQFHVTHPGTSQM
nr:unnamed protein product [Spirometra erinaceieuropaei]